jgi:cellulose synthase/poly-beta-1,6-N-acetylglucosamine synthase-like glycosyltransferase
MHARIVEWLVGFTAETFEPLFIFVVGQPFPQNREALVDKYLETDAEFLFFLDDDTIPPPDAIEKLLSSDKDMVTGITWGKKADKENKPMIGYQNPRNGIIQWTTSWVYPDLFRIDGCGLSCALIKRSVLDGMTKPRFLYNWRLKHPNGGYTDIFEGEDIFFSMKVKEIDKEIWANSDVRCQHLDVRTGKDYPSQELWDVFKKENAIGRVFTFDEMTHFNKNRAVEIIDDASGEWKLATGRL